MLNRYFGVQEIQYRRLLDVKAYTGTCCHFGRSSCLKMITKIEQVSKKEVIKF